ncbi:MAG: FG-GAP-like repeat-containing protein [Phycisphaerales bacterium]|nr:FG-GAP-like repeat-containing protein [Phycisphaerales bacterium]
MRHAVVQLVLLTCTVHAVAGSVAVQWTEAEGGNGHWYDRQTNPSGITWIDAGLAAFNNGGHLVTLTSIEENQFVYDSLVVTGNGNIGDWGPWIGARADGTSWHWAITGEPWNYEAWAENEPGSNDDTKAAGYWNHDGGIAQWADHLVDTELLSYIVEYSADCNGDGIVDYGQILDGTFADLDDNGIPDCCDDHTCDSTVIWNTADGGNGHGYQVVFTPDGISWTEARAAAEAAGGHLATVSSAAELAFINSLGLGDKGWLGGYQDVNADDYAEPEGGWRWVTSESWSFIGWWFDAPADNNLRNYMQLAYGQCQDEQDLPTEGEWYVIEYGTPTAIQWAIEDDGNGHWYQAVFVGPNLSWNQSNGLAEAVGGHLVTLTNEQEDIWVIDTFLSTDAHWGYNNNYAFGPHIGGWQDIDADDYFEPGGGWRWTTTEAFAYTNWQGLDNCCGGQDRMMYYKLDGAIGWDDVAQDNTGDSLFTSYIVEWSADCNGDGIVDYGQILDGSYEDLNGNGVLDCCDDGSCLDDGDPTTSQWTNSAGGSFQDRSNWSTPASPNQNMTAILEIDADYTITFGVNAQTQNLLVQNGNVTLDLEGHTYTASNDNSTAIIGESVGDQAVLGITSGSLEFGSGASGEAELVLGYGAQSSGSLLLDGPSTTLDVYRLQAGDRGIGLIQLTNGATINAEKVDLGDGIGSEGHMMLSDESRLTGVASFSLNHGTALIQSPAELHLKDAYASMLISKNGIMIGDGIIRGKIVNRGQFAPDLSMNAFRAYGQYDNPGVLSMSIGESSHSKLKVLTQGNLHGIATLDGGLIVNTNGSYIPDIDSEFQILTADTNVINQFNVALMPDLGDDRYMTVRYPGDGLRAGDQNVDLVVVGFDDYLGFDEPVPVVLVGQPEAMAVADLDNDNDDDIAVSTTGMVSIYFNDDGVFDTYVQVENGNATSVDLVAGDFNGDGFLDLAGTNAVDNSVTIIISNGNGSFMTAVDLDTGAGTNPQGLTAADFNNDNRDDLAISCTGTGQVKLWRSQASGGLRDLAFNEDALIDVGNAPIGIDPGEVEEDKDLDLIDLVVALNGEGKVGVLRNNSTSEMIEFLFDPADDKHVVGQGPTSVALADLDGDTHVDIVTANPDDGSISILLHGERSAAEFLGSVDLPVGTAARSVALADLDDDGDQDIAVIAIGEDDGTFELYVLRNDSNLTNYEQLLIAPAENINITGIPVLVDDGDLDSDGVPDLVTINDAGSGLRGEPGTLGLVRSDPALACPEDLDGNGFVDVDDVLLLISNWNNPYTVDDLLELLGAWGPCR